MPRIRVPLDMTSRLQKELDEARAAIVKLREVLQAVANAYGDECFTVVTDALSATPSRCLNQIRAEVLEDVASHFGNDPQQQWSGFLVALEVRGMKDKPPPE